MNTVVIPGWSASGGGRYPARPDGFWLSAMYAFVASWDISGISCAPAAPGRNDSCASPTARMKPVLRSGATYCRFRDELSVTEGFGQLAALLLAEATDPAHVRDAGLRQYRGGLGRTVPGQRLHRGRHLGLLRHVVLAGQHLGHVDRAALQGGEQLRPGFPGLARFLQGGLTLLGGQGGQGHQNPLSLIGDVAAYHTTRHWQSRRGTPGRRRARKGS